MNNNCSKKISYKKNIKVVESNSHKYVVKLKKSNTSLIYDYLASRNFYNYLPKENNSTDTQEVYRYIEEKPESIEDKAIDLVYILSLLHIKTTIYEDINLDRIKEVYETNMKNINSLNTYYHNLQDYIENKVYMSPAEYLLIRNISQIYHLLTFSKNSLDSWYEEKKNNNKERTVLLHNNLSLDHFLEDNRAYLISWDKAERGYVIYDFLNFYKNEYNHLQMKSLFEIYQSKYQYTKEEKMLFLALLSIPWKIDFNDTNYNNTLKTRLLVNYVIKTSKFLSKDDEKNQKTQEEKLE